ncbi:lipopolysaccharide biosynthesis protein [Flectobacillus roseus]|uniref:Lipopolysaccharide biosynthesis protein n=1 Tax=Flectobacillus roseus TaxID=502259 RepID=A0ABT6YF34_9BACT|nr:lipopolysaccharide biosynthesis protein [Flectobacillus roseus]MDI9862207.1 lipopolysaccharide biosynthesis protein [Flectobacillus roseus]
MKKRLFLNAIVSILQVISMGVAAFVVYKIVLLKLGARDLGIWSLVFSVSSVANVANLGVASSLIKFIAFYHAKEDWKQINKLIGTGFIIVCSFMGLVVGLLYLLRKPLLLLLLSDKDLNIGLDIFPLSLMSLWINTSGAVVLAVLDGLKQTYKRSLIYICSSFVFTISTYLIISTYGLQGLGYAQILQGLFVLLTSWVILIKSSPYLSIRFMKFEKLAFKEIFSYSVKFQLVSLINIFLEPASKFLLAKFGSLSDVGYFEMSNRLVSQVRQLMVSANQVIIPWIAQGDGTRDFIIKIYKKNFDIISFFGFLSMGALIILFPFFSLIWIGELNDFFIFSGIILTFSQLINVHTFPANFTNLGVGNLNHLIYTATTFCTLNCIFGAILGYYFSGIGVVIGWGIALILGSLFQMYLFRKEYSVKYYQVYTNDILFRGLSILICCCIVFFYTFGTQELLIVSGLGLLCHTLLVFLSLKNSQIYSEIVIVIESKFRKKES